MLAPGEKRCLDEECKRMESDDYRAGGRTARCADSLCDVRRTRGRDARRQLVEKRDGEEPEDYATRERSDSLSECHEGEHDT